MATGLRARSVSSPCLARTRFGVMLAMLLLAPGWVVAEPPPPANLSAPGPGSTSQGMQVRLRATPAAPSGAGTQDFSAAVAAYRRQQLTVEIDDVDGRPRGGRFSPLLPPSVFALTYQGAPRVRIDLEDFLSIVDRKDLVHLQKRWRSNRYTMVGIGSATAGLGIILIALSRTTIVGATNCTVRDSIGNCIESDLLSRPAVAATQWTGVGLSVAGLLLSISAAVLPRRLVSVEKLNDLAASYNRRLRERLGLPDEFSYRKPSFGIVPRVAAKGAGLDAVLVFWGGPPNGRLCSLIGRSCNPIGRSYSIWQIQ